MADDTLWDRATAGELWTSSAARTWAAQFAAVQGGVPTASDAVICRWLRQQGIVTDWQAEVLETGCGGPFRLGDYRLESRLESPIWPHVFAARHLPTKFPVLLYFVSGDRPADLERWAEIRRRQFAAQSLADPAWIRFYESVETPEYCWVVGERVELASIADKLGHRGRTTWQSAVATVVRLAQAFEELRSAGLESFPLNSSVVYFQTGGSVRLIPPVLIQESRRGGKRIPKDPMSPGPGGGEADTSDAPEDYVLVGGARTTRADQEIFSLGILLYRMIRGESIRSAAGLPDGSWSSERAAEKLAKYQLPSALVQLLKSFATTNWRSPWPQTSSFAQALSEIGGDAAKIPASPARDDAEISYLQSIRRWQPGTREPVRGLAAPIVIADPEARDTRWRQPLSISAQATPPLSPLERIEQTQTLRRRRSRIVWATWSIAAIVFLASFAAIYNGYRRFVATRTAKTGGTAPPTETIGSDDLPATPLNIEDVAAAANSTEKIQPRAPAWIESLVPDDGQHLWESPVVGPPLDLAGLPLGPTIVFACRPAEITAHPDSPVLAEALGTDVQTRLAQWSNHVGFPPESIAQLIVGYYVDELQQLQPCYLLRFSEPQRLNDLRNRWQVQGYQSAAGDRIFTKGDWAFAPLVAAPKPSDGPESLAELDVATRPGDPEVQSMLAGSAAQVRAALESPTANPLAGTLERLLPKTQERRLVTLLATRAALAGPAVDSWVGLPFAALRPALNEFLPDDVQAICFSAHWDQGLFAELVCESSLDRRSSELAIELTERIRAARDAAVQSAVASAADPYWDRVRLRFDNMVSELARQTRVGAEQGQVLANVWLPIVAGHNLLAATELVLSAGGGGGATPVASSGSGTTPTDLSQLLQARLTLRDANPPDLNILVDNLQTIIRDRFPRLPFEFEIRLSNTDLRVAGITRNQRPGPLELVDQTLEQILTAIVFGANPDKNAKGPDDPLCKLVWVTLPPSDGKPAIILITTRDAAANSSYTLPKPFMK